jgi:hypothetical protein
MTRIVATTYRYKRPANKRKPVALEAHRFPEQPANTTYWLSTNIELKKAPYNIARGDVPFSVAVDGARFRVLTPF